MCGRSSCRESCLGFLGLQPNSLRLGDDVIVKVLNLKKQKFRSIGTHAVKVLEILDVVAKLCVGCSHEDVKQVIHEHWRHSIKPCNSVVEKTQDIAQDKCAFHHVFSLEIAEAHYEETTVNVVGQVLCRGYDAFSNEVESTRSRKCIPREIFA